MKKFIVVIAALVAASGLSFAQKTTVTTINRSKTYKTSTKTLDVWYQGEVNLGYVLDTDSKGGDCSRPYFSTIHGARITEYAFIGLGFGFQYLYDFHNATFDVPIFLNMKGYYPVNDDFAPYVSCSLGGHWMTVHPGADSHGFFDEIGVGLKYRKLNFGLGLQQLHYKGADKAENGFYINIGLVF